MRRRRLILCGGVALCVALAAFLAGCDGGGPRAGGYEPTASYPPRTDFLVLDTSQVPPPNGPPSPGKLNEFVAGLAARGGKLLSPQDLPAAENASLQAALKDLFGTPAAPTVDVPDAASHGLAPETLAAGSRIYKLHCLACHGMTGDGRGPTSLWVYPPARDLRRGQFKFVSTSGGAGWPTRDDLHRALRRGIGGNSMPPFALLNDADIETASAYTLHLLFRGLVEFDLLQRALQHTLDRPMADVARSRLNAHFGHWREAQGRIVDPPRSLFAEPKDAESDAAYSSRVRRGHDLFGLKKTQCLECHRDYGRQAEWRYDLWGVPVRPANLVEGAARGGADNVELFRRVRCGILASGMPVAELTDDETADVVLFLRALPDPRHLPADVRQAVYPEAK